MEALRSEYVQERATLEGQIKVRPSSSPSATLPALMVPLLNCPTTGPRTDSGHLGGREELPSEGGGRSLCRAGADSRCGGSVRLPGVAQYGHQGWLAVAHVLPPPPEALGSSRLFLQSAKTHQAELERERDALRDQLSGAERELRQAEVRSEQQLGEERRLRSVVEEAGLERAELVSKLQTQRAQCDQLERRCAQLQAQAIRGNPHGGGEGASEEKTVAEVQKWKEEIAKVRISSVSVCGVTCSPTVMTYPNHAPLPSPTAVCSQLQASVHQGSVDKEELVGQVSLLQHQLERERQAHQAEVSGHYK